MLLLAGCLAYDSQMIRLIEYLTQMTVPSVIHTFMHTYKHKHKDKQTDRMRGKQIQI